MITIGFVSEQAGHGWAERTGHAKVSAFGPDFNQSLEVEFIAGTVPCVAPDCHPEMTLRLEPEQARALAGRLLAVANAIENIH